MPSRVNELFLVLQGRNPSREEMRVFMLFSDGEPVLVAAAGISIGTASYPGGQAEARQNPNLWWKELLTLGLKMS